MDITEMEDTQELGMKLHKESLESLRKLNTQIMTLIDRAVQSETPTKPNLADVAKLIEQQRLVIKSLRWATTPAAIVDKVAESLAKISVTDKAEILGAFVFWVKEQNEKNKAEKRASEKTS